MREFSRTADTLAPIGVAGPPSLIVFRVDASIRIGNGHVARCLTLAGELRERGAQVVFVCCTQRGDASRLIEVNGYAVIPITVEPGADADNAPIEAAWSKDAQQHDALETLAAIAHLGTPAWIVVDHYGLSATWEHAAAQGARDVLAIDDLANRPHACGMLLDQNYYADLDTRYTGLVPPACSLFLGPRYVLLRPEFRAAGAKLRQRDGRVKRILVSFGSNDIGGETVKALRALTALRLRDVATDVVVGAANPRREEIRALCSALAGCRYHEQIDYMAQLIADADLGLGAGGATAWERCVLGLPTLTIVIAENQLRTTVDTAALGAIAFLGRSEEVDAECIAGAIERACADSGYTREMSRRALALVPAADGAALLASAMAAAQPMSLSRTY